MSLGRPKSILARKPIPFDDVLKDMDIEKIKGEDDKLFVEKLKKDLLDDKLRKSITAGLQKQLLSSQKDKEKEKDKEEKGKEKKEKLEEKEKEKKAKEKEKKDKKRESQVEKEKDKKKKKEQQARESYGKHNKHSELIAGFDISTPFNIQHKIHVDFDYKWTGQDPDAVFELTQKLGEGYELHGCACIYMSLTSTFAEPMGQCSKRYTGNQSSL